MELVLKGEKLPRLGSSETGKPGDGNAGGDAAAKTGTVGHGPTAGVQIPFPHFPKPGAAPNPAPPKPVQRDEER